MSLYEEFLGIYSKSNLVMTELKQDAQRSLANVQVELEVPRDNEVA